MRSKRRRTEIRKIVRKAKGGSPKPPAYEVIHCACGHELKLASGEEDKTFTCPACRGQYKASRVYDPKSGSPVLNVSSVNPDSGPGLPPSGAHDTSAPTEVTYALRPGSNERGDLDDAIEPEPPPRMEFKCPCGAAVVADRKTYDKRAKCAACGARLLVSLIYNGEEKKFTIEPVRIADPPSGDTGRIPKL